MQRRTFLKQLGMASAGLLGSKCVVRGAEAVNVISKHRIAHVEFQQVKYHWPRLVGKNARKGLHGQHHKATVAKLHTDQGAMGWGMSRGSGAEIAESIKGKAISDLIDPATGILSGVPPAFDFALHDLAGIILDKPVYQLLGAQGPKATQTYSGMIYFDELEPPDRPAGIDKVMENCRWDVEYGYRQLKVKIGRSGRWYTHDEGLAADIKIVRMIHEEFGRKVGILVDANDMYSLQDAIEFFKGVEGVPIYWMEEPFVEDLEKSQKLKEWMMANGREKTLYADGERKPNHDVCLKLASEGKLDVYLPDIVNYSMTPWRKIMPSLIRSSTLASPHAWGSLLKTHYAAHLAAGLGNVCTLEGVTCISDEIDFGDYKIQDGKLHVSEKPGFGMKLL